jgi:hypothetical protein
MGLVAYFFIPAREPGPVSRLVAQARLPDDPGFNRRFRLTLNVVSIGVVVAVVASPVAFVFESDSAWRLALLGFAALGLMVALYGVGVTLWWMFGYRRPAPQ